MLKHIVFWKLKEEAAGASQAQNAAKLKGLLEALPALIPEVRELEVGLNLLAGDQAPQVALYTVFDDDAALQRYQVHPEHPKVVAFVREIAAERRAVDYLA